MSYVLKKPESLVITLLLGNILSNVIIVTLITYKLFRSFDEISGLFIVIFTTTILLFVFTSFFPKAYASHNVERAALQMALPVKLMSFIFQPLLSLITIIAGPLLSLVKGNLGTLMQQLTEEEIRTMVEIGHESGVLEQHETKIIHSALNFDQLTVSSILTPRVDIICVTVDTTITEALDLMLKEEYTRMPVYEENIDNIIGVVHIKDIVKAIREDQENLNRSVKNVIREVYHIPENKTVSELLKEMQAKRVQIAIVCDEYGGTAGLVTMEDILEEIVGEIRDEHDIDEMPLIHEINKDMLLVDARVGVGEINRMLGVDLPNNQTIGKLIFDTIGEVPKLEQSVKIDNVELVIKEVDGIRIQKILVTKLLEEDDSEEQDKLSEVSEIR